MSINNVALVGRLTKDVELKYSQSGAAVARFNLAVSRQFKKDGQPEADFIGCLAFNKTAENLANFMRKGSQIGIIGRIQTGSYEKDGQRIYTTDVVCDSIQFLEPRGEQTGQQNTSQGGYDRQQQPQYNQAPPQQQAPQQQAPQYNQPPQQQYGGQPQYNQATQQQSRDPFANGGQMNVSESDLPF